jgi:hypothetical protein
MGGIGGLTADSRDVYWTSWSLGGSSAVMKLAGVSVEWTGGSQHLGPIAVSGANIAWVATETTAEGTRHTSILTAALSRGAAMTLAVGSWDVRGLAMNATDVYWIDAGTLYPEGGFWKSKGDGSVMRAPVAGGSSIVVAAGQAAPGSIALGNDAVYWTTSSGGTVMRAPFDGGEPRVLSGGQMTPLGIAVDATRVYWGAQDSVGNFGIMTAPITGGPVAEIAPLQNAVVSIAADEANVYWATDADPINGGSILKIAKP